MKLIKSAVERILAAVLEPDSVQKIGNTYNNTVTSITCLASPIYRESVRRIKSYKNRHKGERCFIIGNGPSLKKMDLFPLKDEVTFGLNRIYLLFESMGFTSTYFVSINPFVIEQSAGDIERIQCPKFISFKARRFIRFDSDTIFLKKKNGPTFCRDVSTQGIWEGSTVTYVAMQLAYYMGFSEVILIGVDHSFQTKGKANETVVAHGDDPNHFDPNYFSMGYKWQLPDLDTSEHAYRLAKQAFESDGRRIVDATIGGKLKVFPKVEYKKALSLA